VCLCYLFMEVHLRHVKEDHVVDLWILLWLQNCTWVWGRGIRFRLVDSSNRL